MPHEQAGLFENLYRFSDRTAVGIIEWVSSP
jgi:hypothetical protein